MEEMEKEKGGTEERPVTSERLEPSQRSLTGPGLTPRPFCPMRLQKWRQPKNLK